MSSLVSQCVQPFLRFRARRQGVDLFGAAVIYRPETLP